MPTVIDSLIVTLGLDPSGFKKGQKEAAQALLQSKQNFERTGRDIEHRAKSMSEFMGALRGNVLLMFAALTGGRGLKQFMTDVTQSNAALGRMAPLVGTTARELSKWQGAVTSLGGDAKGVAGSIAALDRALVDISLVPSDNPALLPYLRALGVSLQGANGKIKTATQLLPELNAAVQGLDKREASSILAKIGLNEDLIQVVIQSREEFRKTMADQERWGLLTEKQSKEAMLLQRAIAGVTLSFTTLARQALEAVNPALVSMATRLSNVFVWFQKHPEEAKAALLGIAAAVGVLVVALGGPITWLAAIGAAAAVLYDDWATWNETGKSNFGNFWQYVTEGWKKIDATAREVWNSIKDVAEPIIRFLFESFKNYIDYQIKGWNLLKALLFGTSQEIRDAWSDMLGAIKKQWDNVWENLVKTIYNAAPAIFDAMKKAFGAAFGWVMDRANTIWRAITGNDLFEKTSLGDTSMEDPATIQGGYTTGGKGRGSGSNTLHAPVDRKQLDEDIADYQRMGWSREQAIGIVANTVAESGGKGHTAVGDGGAAYGIHQWHPDRQANFRKVFGKDIRDSTRAEQRAFTDWELRNTESKAGEYLKRTTSPGQAAQVFSTHYERPKYTGLEAAKRWGLAEELAKGGQSSPGGLPPAGAPTAAAASSTTSSNVNVNVDQITVNAPNATDAKGVAAAIKPELSDAIYAAQQQGGFI